MKKSPLLIVILFILVALLGYNFFTKCSEYGGVMGVSKQCTCYGLTIPHPGDLLENRPGFSSTMCLGVQVPSN